MRVLNSAELAAVSGGVLSDILSVASGVSGMIYGATLGAYFSAPIAITGLLFTLVPDNGTLVEGISLSVQILATGAMTGAVIGGAVGFMFGSSTGYLVDMLGL